MEVKDIENLDEYFDYNTILERMLSKVSTQVDKREGSIIYDAIAPAAAELAQMYITLKYNIDLVFVDTAPDEYLERLANQVGIERKEATYAVKEAEFHNAEDNSLMDINIGERFTIEDLIYKTIEKISTGKYRVQCETAGIIGNSITGNMIPVNYIDNLGSCILSNLLIPGEDIESDESLRARILEQTAEKPFAGNVIDYKNKTKEINGVGAVKVTPIWNGPGTVKLTILNSEFNKASDLLISNVQNEIDPDLSNQGLGLAPIGHVVTVNTINNLNITIKASITTNGELTPTNLNTKVEEAINGYLLELRKEWENETNLIIRKARIEALILGIEGVVDVSNVKINGQATNVTLEQFEIPVLEEVVIE